jgi:hypothetical protein
VTIVFDDTFTGAGSATDIASWPSGSPDYSYIVGASGLNVQTSGYCTRAGAGEILAKVIDGAGAVTGDQKNTFYGVTYLSAGGYWRVGARAGGSPVNFYFAEFSAGNVDVYRYDNGAYTLLGSYARSLVNTTRYDTYIKVTGSGATISIEIQAGATAVINLTDTSGSRLTSGVPCFGCYDQDLSYGIDRITVDDLASAIQYSYSNIGSRRNRPGIGPYSFGRYFRSGSLVSYTAPSGVVIPVFLNHYRNQGFA